MKLTKLYREAAGSELDKINYDVKHDFEVSFNNALLPSTGGYAKGIPQFVVGDIEKVESKKDPDAIIFKANLTNGKPLYGKKLGKWRSHWMWFYDDEKYHFERDGILAKILRKELLDDLASFEYLVSRFDWYHGYSDDHRSYESGRATQEKIKQEYEELVAAGKEKEAKAIIAKHKPKSMEANPFGE